jgi:DNA-binding NarL/FixJ family response regulator
MIDIIVIDDHELLRTGLCRVLESQPDFRVVAEAASLAQARAIVPRHRPAVCVIDLRLGDGDGMDFIRETRSSEVSRGGTSPLGFVVLTGCSDLRLLEAMKAGASAYIAKTAPIPELLAAVRHAAAAPLSFTASGLCDAIRRAQPAAHETLTERETQVLHRLQEGFPVATIARELYMSGSTCKTHVSRIYDKLQANNRTSAVMAGIRLGLLEAPGMSSAA